MPDIKHHFRSGRMNKDLDERIVPNGEYRDAQNIEIITSEGSNVGSVQNVPGTVFQNVKNYDENLKTSTDWGVTSASDGIRTLEKDVSNGFTIPVQCIGSVADEQKNNIYWFISSQKNFTAKVNTTPITARVNGAIINSTSLVLDNNSGTISVGDVITGSGIAGHVTVTTVTDQYNIVLSSAQYLDDNVDLTFVTGTTDIIIDNRSDTFPHMIESMIVCGEGIYGTVRVTSGITNGYRLSNKVFVKNDTLLTFKYQVSAIAEYNTVTKEVAPVLVDRNNILKFSSSYLITAANILDGLLLFTDNQTEPKKIKISDFKSGSSTFYSHTQYNDTDFTEKDITVIKLSPLNAPTLDLFFSERSLNSNGLENGATVKTFKNFLGLKYGDEVRLNFFPHGNFIKDDIIKLTHKGIATNENSSSSENESVTEKEYELTLKVKLLINSKKINSENIDTETLEADCIIQNIQKDINDDKLAAVDWKVTLQEKKPIFEEKFMRFAYRWKYDDNQYSTFSPFSKTAFIPDTFSYNSLDSYNSGMSNNLRLLVIKNLDSKPANVKSVDILMKESNNNTVYILDTIKNNDTYYNVLSENIRSVVESNQILRPYDNVPKRAKAQEISSNRLIYANYYQGYDMLNDNIPNIETTVKQLASNASVKQAFETPLDKTPNIFNSRLLTSSIREKINESIEVGMSVSGNNIKDNTFVKSIDKNNNKIEVVVRKKTNKTFFDSYNISGDSNNDIENLTELTFTKITTPTESVKSQRTYQIGTTFSDVYGRESPVFSSVNSSVKLDKSFCNTKNSLTAQIKSNYPDWATHYKLFVKETSSEYYNLALDRFYFAEDGNVWLSFPSAERNKVDEENYLILKKKHDKNEAVTEEARYKILDISNEAPRFISTEIIAAGKASCETLDRNQPEVGNVFFKFAGPSPQENPAFANAFRSQNQIEISTNVSTSDFNDQKTTKRYTIKSGGSSNNNVYSVELENPISPEDNNVLKDTTTETQGTVSGTVTASASVTLTEANANIAVGMSVTGSGITGSVTVAEISGTALTLSSTQSISDATELKFLTNFVSFGKEITITIFEKRTIDKDEFFGRFFVKINRDYVIDNCIINSFNAIKSSFEPITNQLISQNVQNNFTKSSNAEGENTYRQEAAWSDSTHTDTSDSITSTHPKVGSTEFVFYWSGIDTPSGKDDGTENINNFISNISKSGALIQFSNDFGLKGSIYQVTSSRFEPEIRKPGANYDKFVFGKRRKYIIGINKYLKNKDKLAFDDTFDSGLASNDSSGNGRISKISIMKELVFIGESTLSSDNPAIFETEPKTLEGLDIYYEASNSLPIIKAGMTVVGPKTGALAISSIISSVESGDTFNLLTPSTSDVSFDDILTITDEKNTYSFDVKVLETDKISIKNTGIVKAAKGKYLTIELKGNSKVSVDDIVIAPGGVEGVIQHEFDEFTQTIVTDVSTDGNNTLITVFQTGYAFDTGNLDYAFVGDEIQFVNNSVVPVSTTGATSITLQTNQVFGQVNELDWFNCYSFGQGVESNRIKDDFNAPTIDKGAIVSTTLENEYTEEHKQNSFIFSGIFNSTSGVNELNQFIQALPITKEINPIYGSIQKIFVRETDLITFCEDKVLKVLANKDALFNADGNTNLTASTSVLGQAIGYVGEYGISKNPESFSSHAFRIYFADKARGAVLRLSRDGLTDISAKGMTDFFGDNLASSSDIIGSYNEEKGSYNISLNSQTLCFDERVDGWTSFKSYIPENGLSINNIYYTFKNGHLFAHNNTVKNKFYDITDAQNDTTKDYESSIKFLFNDFPNSIKSFKSLNYEGSDSRKYTYGGTITKDAAGNNLSPNVTIGAGTTLVELQKQNYNSNQIDELTETEVKGWYADSIVTDQQSGSVRFFKEKENFKFNKILGDTTTTTNLDTKELSVQGLGIPASISTSGAAATFSVTVSIANSDTHNTILPTPVVLYKAAGATVSQNVTMIISPVEGFLLNASDLSHSSADSGETSSSEPAAVNGSASFDADPDNPLNVRITIPLSFTMPSNAQTVQVNITGEASQTLYNLTGIYNTDEVNTSSSSLYNFGYSNTGNYFVNSTVNGAVNASTSVTLEQQNSFIADGMAVIGPGITNGTTVSAISGTSLTLSSAATIPDGSVIKYGKKILEKSFISDSGSIFDVEPTLNIINQDTGQISDYAFNTDWEVISVLALGKSSNIFEVTELTAASNEKLNKISVGDIVVGDGIISFSRITSISSDQITIDQVHEVSTDVDNSSGEALGTVTLSFYPPVVKTNVYYVFGSNNPIEDRLLIKARASKASLSATNSIKTFVTTNKLIEPNGGTYPITITGKPGAVFSVKKYADATVDASGGCDSSENVFTLAVANHAITPGMIIEDLSNSNYHIGIVSKVGTNGRTITNKSFSAVSNNAELHFYHYYNPRLRSFASSDIPLVLSNQITINDTGSYTINKEYGPVSNSVNHQYEINASAPTTIASDFISSNKADNTSTRINVKQLVNSVVTLTAQEIFTFTDSTCDTEHTGGNETVVTHADNANIKTGYFVTGTGIPTSAYITAVNTVIGANDTFTLSANATATNTNTTLTFTNVALGGTSSVTKSGQAGSISNSSDAFEKNFSFSILARDSTNATCIFTAIDNISEEMFKYSTIEKRALGSGSNATDVVGSGMTIQISFDSPVNVNAIVASTDSDVATQVTHLNASNKKSNQLPDGFYVKSIDDINTLTIAHNTKKINDVKPWLIRSGNFRFTAPLNWEINFANLSVETSSDNKTKTAKGTMVISKYGIGNLNTSFEFNDIINLQRTISGTAEKQIGFEKVQVKNVIDYTNSKFDPLYLSEPTAQVSVIDSGGISGSRTSSPNLITIGKGTASNNDAIIDTNSTSVFVRPDNDVITGLQLKIRIRHLNYKGYWKVTATPSSTDLDNFTHLDTTTSSTAPFDGTPGNDLTGNVTISQTGHKGSNGSAATSIIYKEDFLRKNQGIRSVHYRGAQNMTHPYETEMPGSQSRQTMESIIIAPAFCSALHDGTAPGPPHTDFILRFNATVNKSGSGLITAPTINWIITVDAVHYERFHFYDQQFTTHNSLNLFSNDCPVGIGTNNGYIG